MPFQRLRRDVLMAALVSSALVVACGGGRIESDYRPTRGILLDGGGNTWAQFALGGYGAVPTVLPTGGTGYALGSAPINVANGTLTLSQRVDAVLAGGVGADDLILMSGGIPDIAAAVAANDVAAVTAAASAMAAQVLRLENAGARHILVVNNYDLSITPAFVGSGAASSLTAAFNLRLLEQINDRRRSTRFIDAFAYFNEVRRAGGGGYGLTDVTAPACTGSAPGVGIVSTTTCTSGAFGANDPNAFLFYDPMYLSEGIQRTFGSFVYGELRTFW